MSGRDYCKLGIAALLGMVLLISLFSSVSVPLSALELRWDLSLFSSGITEIIIPPFGTVRANTHFPPLKFQITLENINLDLMQDMIIQLAEEDFVLQLEKEIRSFLYYFFIRILLLGFVGGAAGIYLMGEKKLGKIMGGGSAGLAVLLILILTASFTYNYQAFSTPEFEGVLTAAPWMVNLIEESFIKVDTLGKQMEKMAENISRVFGKMEEIEILGGEEGDLRVLHVSDIHNNPAGVKFINQVINTFEVDLVIDTGDITDFGTPLETELIAMVAEFEVPYVFIPGNHDSPEVVSRMREIDQVIVLEEGKINIFGLNIAGIADPSSYSREMAVASQEVLEEYANRLKEIVNTGEPVHIVAAHHFRLVQDFIGEIPLVLHGHTHSFQIREEGGSIIIDAGTSGAAGIRGLQVRQEVPYSVILLHFLTEEKKEPFLVAADIIKVFQLQRGFTLERKVFE
ncbi:MAG: metallophosphoesterase [Candidatus Syntrophonatronum acetioxidans]|uniref:Metallophosphoesterase n=1 Tax=Candidatus Syntrophonatronum acetioxidans TaxID=1795816 RepID=A0A424YDR0_9FIRM|nr:MAG: metallophosphoesterase [Candidatus Syntrophonatronum acetioxidans]